MKDITKQLDHNKNDQVKLIRQGFDKIIEALVQKRNELVQQTVEKYDAEADNYTKFSRASSIRDKTLDRYKTQIVEIKSIRENQGKTQALKKIRALQAFNHNFQKEVDEVRRISENTNKLDSIDSSHKGPQLGEEFTPKSIDSTAAISYILNMTLDNQSLSKAQFHKSATSGLVATSSPLNGKMQTHSASTK